jgi:hypothetical protein
VASRFISFGGVGPGFSVGLPVTIALSFPTRFHTDHFVYFEDFEGPGLIMETGMTLAAGYSVMKGVLAPRTSPLALDLSGWQIGFGGGGDTVGGYWKYVGLAEFICRKGD